MFGGGDQGSASGSGPVSGRSEELKAQELHRRRNRPLHLVVRLLLALLVIYLVLLIAGPGTAIAAVTVVLACSAVGSLLGFIFAIPKRTDVAIISAQPAQAGAAGGQSSESAPPQARQVRSGLDSAYRPNTSLEEISDWLTKIVVGLGLVQATAIGRFVEQQGAAISPALFGTAGTPLLGAATIVATTVISFLASYLYFRLCLAEEFARSDVDAAKASREEERERAQFEEAKEKGHVQVLSPREVLDTLAKNPAVPTSPVPEAPGDAVLEGAASGEELPDPRDPLQKAIDAKLAEMRHRPHDPADPVNGLFGERPDSDSPPRSLTAKVKPVRGETNWFQIDLLVTSREPKLRDEVAFFLHPTFPDPATRVFVLGGQARMRLYAYGAFTVGVLADGGETELELDLARLEDAPEVFRNS